MNLVVGLGNPGAKHARSRHNVGFMVLDELAEKHSMRFNQKRDQSVVARGRLDDLEVVLAKPQTYMNLSGRAVHALLRSHGFKPANLLVVYDDFDLALGTLRIREHGSAGTHNGMRSIVETTGTNEFPRLRVGIGAADRAPAREHVLSDFNPAEQEQLEQVSDRAAEAIETIIKSGLQVAMNRFNS